MIKKIAWRNVFRQPLRSTVLITAIVLGLAAGIFASAIVQGMMKQKVDSVIEMELSHLQIHAKGFRDDPSVDLLVPEKNKILNYLSKNDSVLRYSERLISIGMIGTANKNGSVKIVGVNPEKEALLTGIDKKIVKGTFFQGAKGNPICISTKMAKTYKIDLGNKVVLTFQNIKGEITAGAFRVVGLFDTKNGMYDERNVFVDKTNLASLMGVGDQAHEIAVYVKKHEWAEAVASNLSKKTKAEVLPWLDLAPGMRYMVEAMGVYLYFIMGIILLALLFSIVNTMLMAVLERYKELGMLMAVGFNKGKIFGMILWETVFITLIGAPLGLLLSYGLIAYFGKNGLHLPETAAYQDMGFSNVLYPFLEAKSYAETFVMVVVTAFLAALYPALRAIKLKPAEAIRKI